MLSLCPSIPRWDIENSLVLACSCLLPFRRPSLCLLLSRLNLSAVFAWPRFADNSLLPQPFPGLTLVGPCVSWYGSHSWTRCLLCVPTGSETTSPVLQDTLLLVEFHLTSGFFTTAWHCWLIFSLWLMTSSGSFLFFLQKLPPKTDYRINCCCNVRIKKKNKNNPNFPTVPFWGHAIHVPEIQDGVWPLQGWEQHRWD